MTERQWMWKLRTNFLFPLSQKTLLIASVPQKSCLLCDSPLLDPTAKCVVGDSVFFPEITFLFEVHHDRTSG